MRLTIAYSKIKRRNLVMIIRNRIRATVRQPSRRPQIHRQYIDLSHFSSAYFILHTSNTAKCPAVLVVVLVVFFFFFFFFFLFVVCYFCFLFDFFFVLLDYGRGQESSLSILNLIKVDFYNILASNTKMLFAEFQPEVRTLPFGCLTGVLSFFLSFFFFFFST